MRKALFVLISFSIAFGLSAQSRVSGFYTDARDGRWTNASYGDNMVQFTFTPSNYKNDENISDAVVMKPMPVFSKQIKLAVHGDSIIVSYLHTRLSFRFHQDSLNKGFSFALQPGEMIFGGGERALPLDRRGYRLNLYNNPWYGYAEGADNLNYSVPFITSSAGYGLFFDNPSKGYLDIGKTTKDVLEYGASSGALNVYIIFGDYRQVLQSYFKLTGTQPLPPRWAFGNLMSRFGYTSEKQVKDILSKMKNEQVPVDAVIFDLFWFGDSIKHTMGNLDWVNKDKWPGPAKMIGDLKKQNIKTILVTEPFFVETSRNYGASKPYLAVDSLGRPYYLTDFYFGHGGLIDIFRKDARQWFWKFYKKQMDNGVEAWWGDLGEPEKHPSDLYHNLKDYGYTRLFKADEVHNLYGHTWTKMLFANYAKNYPDKRLFSLNRSGFAGSQRYAIFPWTGDVSRSWSGLRSQLPVLLGMSMSGVPYVHSDAGGFAGGEGDNELYVRWLQFAALTPIFRPHGTALYEVEPGAFSFPSEVALIDTPWREYAKLAVALRYAMLPYNYSLAYEQAKYGKPLMAPLYYYFPADTNAVKIQDEYMWGENLLVAPVLEKGSASRKYYLPAGTWYQPVSREFRQGKSWYSDSVDMETIPVFIKEGGFLVTAKGGGNTKNRLGKELFVLYNSSARPSSYELYFDDGETRQAIEKNKYQLVKFISTGIRNNKLLITITSTNGSFAGKPAKRAMDLIIPKNGPSPKKIMIDNRRTDKKTGGLFELGKNQWTETDTETIVTISFTGKPVTIELLW
jgi:oligosaccharide 4-alpha-D-glucosyltransferase